MSITPFFHVYHKYVFNMANINKIKLSGTTYSIQDENATKTVELTQAQYNALTVKDPNTFYVITDAQGADLTAIENRLSEDEEVTAAGLNALNDRLSEDEEVTAAGLNTLNESKQDTLISGTNIKTINNESILGSGNINIQGGGGTVESAITSGSTNAVESKAIWSATTFNKGILLTFNGQDSTNYPEGCGKLVVNVRGYGSTTIVFKNNEGWHLGRIEIQNLDGINISVDTSEFGGATYEISGTTVILSYPSTGITSVQTFRPECTYTAVIEGAWVNENTYMKSEVDAIASGLQNNINSKLDASAYTPTVVDSALNVASTNPVQNQALYSELRIDNGETETTLTFENSQTTNYPNGCTKLIVEDVGLNTFSNIEFYDGGQRLGYIYVSNFGDIMVDTSRFEGSTYEISGTTVIINYPTVTSVTRIRLSGNGNYVYKAIVANATSLKDQVLANTTALASKQTTLTAGTNITIVDNVISAEGGSDINVVQTTGTSTTDVMSQNAVTTQLGGYVTTDTEQHISGRKVFTYSASSGKAIEFKQTSDAAKVGFSVKNSASTNNELASFEFRPNTFTIDGVQHPLMYFGHYRNKNTGNAGVPQTVIGFRQYDQLNAAAYHYLMPLPEKAKTPFSLTTSFKDYYAPMGFKNGSTMITADDTGVVDLSSELGGLKLVKLSEAEYNALATKDSSTLYIIVN